MKEVRVLLFKALSLCHDHQEWLAAVVGVNKSTVYRWVNEEFKPRYGVIHKMQEFVNAASKDKRKRLSENDFRILCKKERKLREYNTAKKKKKKEKEGLKLGSNTSPDIRAPKLF